MARRRASNRSPRPSRDSQTLFGSVVDAVTIRSGTTRAADSAPTGFPSVDQLLGGGLRREDLIVVGGDVGSGKSALALAMAVRVAELGRAVVFYAGEVSPQRVAERVVAIEGRPASTTCGVARSTRRLVVASRRRSLGSVRSR